MSREQIQDYFRINCAADSVKIIDSYQDHPELHKAMQDATAGITKDVFNGVYEGIRDLIAIGDDSPTAFEPKEFCNVIAVKHLVPIVEHCTTCDPPQLLQDLKAITRDAYLYAVATVKIKLLPESETETN